MPLGGFPELPTPLPIPLGGCSGSSSGGSGSSDPPPPGGPPPPPFLDRDEESGGGRNAGPYTVPEGIVYFGVEDRGGGESGVGGKDGDSVTAAVGGTPGGVENGGFNGDVAGCSEDTVYFGIEFGGGVEDGVDGVGGTDGGAVDAAVGGTPGGGVEDGVDGVGGIDGGAVDDAVGGSPDCVGNGGSGKDGGTVDDAVGGSPGDIENGGFDGTAGGAVDEAVVGGPPGDVGNAGSGGAVAGSGVCVCVGTPERIGSSFSPIPSGRIFPGRGSGSPLGATKGCELVLVGVSRFESGGEALMARITASFIAVGNEMAPLTGGPPGAPASPLATCWHATHTVVLEGWIAEESEFVSAAERRRAVPEPGRAQRSRRSTRRRTEGTGWRRKRPDLGRLPSLSLGGRRADGGGAICGCGIESTRREARRDENRFCKNAHSSKRDWHLECGRRTSTMGNKRKAYAYTVRIR